MKCPRLAFWIAAITTLGLLPLPLRAQLPSVSDVDHSHRAPATGPLPDWDVATVKPHASDDPNMSWQFTDDSVTLRGLPLEQMICMAWDIKSYQLSGLSGWMKDSRFDLIAKVSSDDLAVYKKLSVPQQLEMLRRLLTERFQLKVHKETKTLPIYDLVVDKSGSKLKPNTLADAPSEEEAKAHPEKFRQPSMSSGQGMFDATGMQLNSLVSQLENALERRVHDETGLTGEYDFKLRYRAEDTPANSDDADKPSLFSALQDQLGLRLVPDKGPVETLVVDAAQQPEAN